MIGRFTSADDGSSQDPGDPQSWNLYSYGHNNPLSFIDSDGGSYQVCVSDGNGGQQCFTLNDDQYQSLYAQQNGRQEIGLSGGSNGGSITCDSNVCGSVSYMEDSLRDVSADFGVAFQGGKLTELAVGHVGGWVARLLGRTAVEAESGPAASGLGDLTSEEMAQIRSVVNKSNRPIEVVGSAARGARRGTGSDLPIGKGPGTQSDIDHVAPPSSHHYFQPYQEQLPGLDPNHGLTPGTQNSYIGPAIRFEAGTQPRYIPLTGSTK